MRPYARRNLQLLAIAGALALTYFLVAPLALEYSVNGRSFSGVLHPSPFPRMAPRPPAIPEGQACDLAAAPSGTFQLRMDTGFHYCYTLATPTGANTELVWQVTQPNTTVNLLIEEVCSPAAGCFEGLVVSILLYNTTASFGSTQWSNPRGFAVEIGLGVLPPCGLGSAGASCGNVTVLVSGAWN